MKKVLVTGANGYIGSNVVRALLDLGHEVIACDFGCDHVDDRAVKMECNLFEERENAFEFFGSPDICIHLAWRDGFNHGSFAHIEDLPKHFSFINSLVAGGVKQVAVMGSMHEIGYHEGVITSTTQTNPSSYYGIAKNALHQMLSVLSAKEGFKLLWLRAFYILGQDERNNSVFTKLRETALAGKKTFPFTSGKNRYDFIAVEDLALEIALATVQEECTDVIHVCSGRAISLREQVEDFIAANGFDIALDFGAFPDRPYDSPEVYGDARTIASIVERAQAAYAGTEMEPRLAELRSHIYA